MPKEKPKNGQTRRRKTIEQGGKCNTEACRIKATVNGKPREVALDNDRIIFVAIPLGDVYTPYDAQIIIDAIHAVKHQVLDVIENVYICYVGNLCPTPPSKDLQNCRIVAARYAGIGKKMDNKMQKVSEAFATEVNLPPVQTTAERTPVKFVGGINADKPAKVVEFLLAPYNSIERMPFDVFVGNIMQYFNGSLVKALTPTGEEAYKYSRALDKRGLAIQMGVTLTSLNKYANQEIVADVMQFEECSDLSDEETMQRIISEKGLVLNGKSVSVKDIKVLLLRRAFDMIEHFKVQSLYGSSPVAAMFDLKCNYHWVEESKVTASIGFDGVGGALSTEQLAEKVAAIEEAEGIDCDDFEDLTDV